MYSKSKLNLCLSLLPRSGRDWALLGLLRPETPIDTRHTWLCGPQSETSRSSSHTSCYRRKLGQRIQGRATMMYQTLHSHHPPALCSAVPNLVLNYSRLTAPSSPTLARHNQVSTHTTSQVRPVSDDIILAFVELDAAPSYH